MFSVLSVEPQKFYWILIAGEKNNKKELNTMKFYTISLLQFFKRKNKSGEQASSNANVSNEKEMKKVAANRSVVRFEDCERINRENFAVVDESTRLNSNNQYYATLSGDLQAFN